MRYDTSYWSEHIRGWRREPLVRMKSMLKGGLKLSTLRDVTCVCRGVPFADLIPYSAPSLSPVSGGLWVGDIHPAADCQTLSVKTMLARGIYR